MFPDTVVCSLTPSTLGHELPAIYDSTAPKKQLKEETKLKTVNHYVMKWASIIKKNTDVWLASEQVDCLEWTMETILSC